MIGFLLGMQSNSSSLFSELFDKSEATEEKQQQQENKVHSVDLLPHLRNCDKPQSELTLPELAQKYKPSKFFRYAHSNFDRFYPNYMEKYRTKHFRMLEILSPIDARNHVNLLF